MGHEKKLDVCRHCGCYIEWLDEPYHPMNSSRSAIKDLWAHCWAVKKGNIHPDRCSGKVMGMWERNVPVEPIPEGSVYAEDTKEI
jgi:hypothetical protein